MKEELENNNLICPDYNDLNILDLMKTIYNYRGLNLKETKNMQELKKIIPNNKHVLFILSDGTGSNLIDKLPKDSILKSHKLNDMLTIFPSTTSCVLTSIVTAKFPLEHGIWGWFNHNNKYNIDYYSLLFLERKDNKSLKEYDINPKEIYKEPSLLNELSAKVNVLFPESIVNSVYSKYVGNDENRYSYKNFSDIIEFIKNNCEKYSSSYTYLYLPNIDDLEHDNGVDSKIVLEELIKIDNLVKTLSHIKDLTIIFTADHGQTNIKKYETFNFSKYDKYLNAYPSIDYGTASYFVKDGKDEEFIQEFKKDFDHNMLLFKKEDFINNGFFGLGNVNEETINNLGNYISICQKGVFFVNNPKIEDYYGVIKGNHSGLSRDEMVIPLIVIDTNKIK